MFTTSYTNLAKIEANVKWLWLKSLLMCSNLSIRLSGTFEEGKYRKMVWKDWKSQAIFFEKGKKSQQGIWEIKKQFSKDVVLNELCRQDAALDQPAFKKIFRHDGLFDDDYETDPDGRGTDAIDWLRGTEDAESFDLESDFSGDDGDTEDFDGLEEDV